MATQTQIEANRRNAQHSTGPRTPDGKASSAQNALKHGIRAQAIISTQIELLDEDPGDFADLVNALAKDLAPVGPLEETCVETIAISLWRLRRVASAELGHIADRQRNMPRYLNTPAGHAIVGLPGFDILDKLSRYEAHLDRQMNRALVLLTRLQGFRYLKSKRDALDSPNRPISYPGVLDSPNKPNFYSGVLDSPNKPISYPGVLEEFAQRHADSSTRPNPDHLPQAPQPQPATAPCKPTKTSNKSNSAPVTPSAGATPISRVTPPCSPSLRGEITVPNAPAPPQSASGRTSPMQTRFQPPGAAPSQVNENAPNRRSNPLTPPDYYAKMGDE